MEYFGSTSNNLDFVTKEWVEINAQNAFYVDYNAANYTEIKTAHDGGKAIYLKKSTTPWESAAPDNIPIVLINNQSILFLMGITNANAYYYSLSASNVWSSYNVQIAETVDNKITEISSTSTDIQYPSAKAVYIAMETGRELFFAEYGNTGFEDIWGAIVENNKLAICKYHDDETGFTYNLVVTTYNGGMDYIIFSGIGNSVVYEVKVTGGNDWSITKKTFESTENKVTSISSSSTDAQYPSAKAVNDFIGGKFLTVKCVLDKDSWSDEKKQDIYLGSEVHITENTVGIFALSQNATTEEYRAAARANLQVIEQRDYYITVRANNTVPTINIPCVLNIMGKSTLIED